MRTLSILILSLFIPITALAAARDDSAVVSRSEGTSVSYRNDASTTEAAEPSFYSDIYSNVMTIVRALTAPRAYQPAAQSGNSNNTGRVSPRTYNISSNTATYTAPTASDYDSVISTKQQYISYLKSSFNGTKMDCADKYNKFNSFFNHDSTLSGKITPKDNTPSMSRLDTMCEFLDYSHWCFAMGFAYTIRPFDNPDRIRKGYKCYTYQEFCESRNRIYDNTKTDEYLSKIIDEISFYNKSIRNTDKNTVQVTTEKYTGSSMTTSTTWKSYDTDSWIQERIPMAEMTRLLCK